ncbi:uncharacterized protein MELLADRAFT_110803 [Melampsora larici-populina 98AG31]|uniref:Secreted protein n=1 Tax=Melampsora larici-populina (strain 98AG31 / pathotype 3-4-7) TaxID=747676 RepID=F4S112_MELLP|nr:uncharacterized protein MELLADRAFT_110803 [Melampsora larici-populina 98AG31]EGG01689.1 secreted protein [Melampsora larici-populina 98AG31]
MRFTLTINFVLLGACLSQYQVQSSLAANGKDAHDGTEPINPPVKKPGGHRARGLSARDDFPILITRADTSNDSNGGTTPPGKPASVGTTGYPNVVEPKACAAILKAMKESEAATKGNGAPPPPVLPKGAQAGMTSTSKPAGATRRSKLTQNPDSHLNRRADPSTQTTTDPNACKDMQAFIKSKSEKMAKGLGPIPTKKEIGPTDMKNSSPQ